MKFRTRLLDTEHAERSHDRDDGDRDGHLHDCKSLLLPASFPVAVHRCVYLREALLQTPDTFVLVQPEQQPFRRSGPQKCAGYRVSSQRGEETKPALLL